MATARIPCERGVYVSNYFVFGHPAVMAVSAAQQQLLLMPILPGDDEQEIVEIAWEVLDRRDPALGRERPRVLRIL